ncbi:hypothetical protein DAPPUDRAFT_248071 [Daphnia pulex]|uniref:Uncharacterized protein n=1 Tax=Daphnia pulex TaxID=6669 RepID=E9GTL2_DAPPU|nr:hypothetical protein DAPPUDRAFT_248071 [Daphnia pulex]|eukprot:EFX77100.1 hypothetical protein DAPPUDRAFT_248071 [Daphnia pulex]
MEQQWNISSPASGSLLLRYNCGLASLCGVAIRNTVATNFIKEVNMLSETDRSSSMMKHLDKRPLLKIFVYFHRNQF